MEPLEELEGAHIALLGLGISQIDYVIARENSVNWDETWGCGSSAAVFDLDRLFMMDPAGRFFDTDDAGKQTDVMREILPVLDIPIYSCELDDRVPWIVEYPLQEVVEATKCAYMNTTVAYAVAFAYWNNVAHIDLFGIDFSYQKMMFGLCATSRKWKKGLLAARQRFKKNQRRQSRSRDD